MTPCESLKQGWRFPHSPLPDPPPPSRPPPKVTGDALPNNPARVTFPTPKAGGDLLRGDTEKDYQLLESTKEGTLHRQRVPPTKNEAEKIEFEKWPNPSSFKMWRTSFKSEASHREQLSESSCGVDWRSRMDRRSRRCFCEHFSGLS